MARFTGKRVLTTGGTSGIGWAGAKRIAAEEGRLTLTGTHQQRLTDAQQAAPQAQVLDNDTADPNAAESLARTVADSGGLDGLWLNAGYAGVSDVGDVSAEFFDRMMHANVRGPVLQLAQLVGHLNDGASVVLTSSTATYEGAAMASVYAATKGALIAMARGWATALADRSIRVNVLVPGAISTRFRDFMSQGTARSSSSTSSAAFPSAASAPPRKPRKSPCSYSPTRPPTSPPANTLSTEASPSASTPQPDAFDIR